MEQMIKPIIYWAKYNNFKQFYSFKSTDMMLAFQTHLSQLALISWANILFVLGQLNNTNKNIENIHPLFR